MCHLSCPCHPVAHHDIQNAGVLDILSIYLHGDDPKDSMLLEHRSARNRQGAEVDFVESVNSGNKIFSFKCKWKEKTGVPVSFKTAYPGAHFECIAVENKEANVDTQKANPAEFALAVAMKGFDELTTTHRHNLCLSGQPFCIYPPKHPLCILRRFCQILCALAMNLSAILHSL